jgi:alpha-L-fucosidase
MRKYFILIALLAAGISASAQTAPKPYGVLPTQRQLNWQETDMYCIVHFSMATYTDKEWGYGDEDPKIFNPKSFSALQIVGAAKAGGFKGIVVVAKHHDGFCLWPTKTTEHNISKSPYKNGKGDILKDYQLACQRLGMKMAVYCSPWDRNNPLYGKPEYVTKIYREQLKELYSNYGPVFMSWHDGANGGDGYYGGSRDVRKIDRSTYYGWDTTWAITRKMQPGASIFGDVGPDVRWVGNEEGHAGETYWATYTPHAPDEGKKPANGYVKDYEGTEGTRNGQYWMPAECDVPLRRGWFYHESQDGQSKSAYTLVDLYYKSVGRGAALDLGLSPDKDGLITKEDVGILTQFGNILKQTFAVNLAKGATFKASDIRGNNSAKFGPAFLTDNSRYTYWATKDNVTKPTLEVDLHTAKTFNVIRLRENIKLGQRIEGAAFDAWLNGDWKEIATVPSVGANRLIRLPYNITTAKLRLRITKSPVAIAISDLGLFKEPVHLVAPIISRNKQGEVTITTEAPVGSIRYTTDGTQPTAASPAFTKPFTLADGGEVKAVSMDGSNKPSEISTQTFGLAKSKWNILSDAGDDALKAIDDNANTFSARTKSSVFVVDMGTENIVKAFTYLPRQDKQTDGLVSKYTWDISSNGTTWQTVAAGEFSNIKSNPVEQLVPLKTAVKARYFRLTALTTISGTGISAAEIGAQVK